MAASPAESQGPATQVPLAKPSLRTRLFSTSKKDSKIGKEAGETAAASAAPIPGVSASNDTSPAGEGSSSDIQGGRVPIPQPASASAEALTSSPSDSGSPAQSSEAKSQDKEIDRERGSLNTTHTGLHKQTPFYRRKANKSSTSEGAMSSSTSHTIVKTKAPVIVPAKPSFLSRVVYKVVPCVGTSSRAHPIILDEAASIASEPKLAVAQVHEVAVAADPEVDKSGAGGMPSAGASTAAPLVAPHVDPPAPYTDSEIVILPPPHSQLLPEEETDGLTSGAVQPPGSTGGEQVARLHAHDADGTDGTSTDEEGDDHVADEQAEEERLIKNGGVGIPIGPDGVPRPLLPPISPEHAGRKCLVLDLDETLVHSSFRAIQQADFIVPVEIELHWHHFHVLKRPGVDNFLKKMGELYEVVVFTASLSKYADPVLDKLDIHQVVAHRLFRESCYSHKGNYVKDLSQLGRPIADTIILDNSPASYIFHPTNAVPVSSWFNDPHDAELTDLIPFLADLTSVDDVRGILDGAR